MRRVPEQNVPKTIQQRADSEQLGALQRIYERGRKTWFYSLAGIMCGLFGIVLIGAFVVYYESTFIWWSFWQAYMIPAVGLCWLFFGIWLIATAIFSPGIRAYIFARGFIYHRRKPEVMHWNQVETLWKAYKLRGNVKERGYTLQCQGEKTFVLSSHLEEFELLGQFLDKVIKRRWLSSYITAYYQGEVLDFQEIVLDQQGLGIKKGAERLPWQDFAGAKLDETTLSLFAKAEQQPWAIIPGEWLPNIEVLQPLLEHILRDTTRRNSSQVAAYNTGVAVNFGKLSISQQGVTLDNAQKHLPWSEVASIGIGESEVIIRRQGSIQEWYAIPLWAIVNAAALSDLLEHILLNQLV